jgi:hypothetical protein
MALAAVVAAGALVVVPRILSANPSDPPPSQSPSQSPSPDPTQEPSGPPSPSPSPSPDPTDTADGLVAGPGRVEDEQDGFALDLPDGWYTNAPGSADDAFAWFGPDRFDPATADGWTVPIRIMMGFNSAYGPGGIVVSQEDVVIGGFPAVRMEIQGEAGGFIPPNALNYVYLVEIDGEMVDDVFPGRFLVATLHGTAGDYEANQAVLDSLMESLEILD